MVYATRPLQLTTHIRKLERIFMGNTPIGCINNSKILKCEENEWKHSKAYDIRNIGDNREAY